MKLRPSLSLSLQERLETEREQRTAARSAAQLTNAHLPPRMHDHALKEASVHFLMGKVCKKLGKLDDAMMRFTFALDLEPKDNNLIKSAIDRLEEPDVSEDEKF